MALGHSSAEDGASIPGEPAESTVVARVNLLEQALTWAMAEIDGRTAYQTESQRENAYRAASDALSGESGGGFERDHPHHIEARAYGLRWVVYVNGEPLLMRGGLKRLFHSQAGALEAASMDAWCRSQDAIPTTASASGDEAEGGVNP